MLSRDPLHANNLRDLCACVLGNLSRVFRRLRRGTNIIGERSASLRQPGSQTHSWPLESPEYAIITPELISWQQCAAHFLRNKRPVSHHDQIVGGIGEVAAAGRQHQHRSIILH